MQDYINEVEIDAFETSDKELETFLSDNNLSDFLRIFRKYKVPSKEENLELWRRAIAGDDRAKDLLVESNMRLVFSFVFKKCHNLHSYEKLDVIQEGSIGLITAIEKYDESRGAFSTCAMWYIKHSITRSLKANDEEIRRPSTVINSRYRFNKIIQECDNAGKPYPSDEELMKILDISRTTLNSLKTDFQKTTKSLNATQSPDDEEFTLESVLGTTEKGYDGVLNRIFDNELMISLKTSLSSLDYYIIYHHILSSEPKTLEEMEKDVGLSKQLIDQREAKLKSRLALKFDENRIFMGVNSEKLKNAVNIDDYSVLPKSINKIIMFLFVKDVLTQEERWILRELWLTDHIKHTFHIMTYLNKDKSATLEVIKKLLSKVKAILESQKEEFEEFKINISNALKSNIFDCDLDMDVSVYKLKSNLEMWENVSYDDFLACISENGIEIPNSLRNKLEMFFSVPSTHLIHPWTLERKINFIKFKVQDCDKLDKNKLRHFYVKNRQRFTEIEQQFIEIHLGMKSINEAEEKFPYVDFRHMSSNAIQKLYMKYFCLRSYRNYNMDREKYLKNRKVIIDRISSFDSRILDMFFGYRKKTGITQAELAENLGVGLEDAKNLLRTAKRQAGNVLADINATFTLNRETYRDYLRTHLITFDEPAGSIVKGYFLQNLSYETLAQKYGKSTLQISNIITTALWKIDSYRFGLFSTFPFPLNVMKEVLAKSDYDEESAEILKNYFKEGTSVNLNIDSRSFNNLWYTFKRRCINYITKEKKVSLIRIQKVIMAPYYAQVLTEDLLQCGRLAFQVKCAENPLGIKYSPEAIADKLGITRNAVMSRITTIINSTILYVNGYLKGPYDFIDILELKGMLADVHLPISEKEKEMLRHLYFEGWTEENLSLTYNMTPASVRRRIIRAIITIRRYQNKEIKGSVSFEHDIQQYLKYFSKNDQAILIDYYRDNLVVKDIATKYGVSFGKMNGIIYKLRLYLNDLQAGLGGLDFDYFWEHVNDDDVPYYGNKQLAIELFHLYYEQRLGIPDILLEHHPELKDESEIRRKLYCLIIAVLKKREGKTRIKYTYEEIRDYYLSNAQNMGKYRTKYYQTYFEDMAQGSVNHQWIHSYDIIYDLLRCEPDYIWLRNLNKDETKKLIWKYRKYLTQHEIREICRFKRIKTRDLMSGKDIRQVLTFLASVEAKISVSKRISLTDKDSI